MKDISLSRTRRPPEIVLVSAASQLSELCEVIRTAGATDLLDRWFSASKGAPGLPAPLARALAIAVLGGEQRWRWTSETGTLHVSLLPVTGPASLWVMLLHEDEGQLSTRWRRLLTPREIEVVEGVARGWDNRLIADEMRCSKATVKKHLQHVFDKLGVSSRTALLVAISSDGRLN